MADKDDDWQERVNAMADELKLEGRDRSDYIHEHMTRKGYRAVPNYVLDDEGEEEEGSGFFRSGSRSRSRRDDDDRGSRKTRRSRDDDDW